MVRRKISWQRKLLFSLVATTIGLGSIESMCRLVVASSPDARWQHHRKLVVTIGFAGLNQILEPDSKLFWRLRANVRDHQLSGEIGGSAPLNFSVSTDAENHRRMPVVANADRRILFLGDSCTFGVGVNDDETFASLLQGRFSDVQCVNAGVPGYSAYQGAKRLENARAIPNTVVISFLFNDESSWDARSDVEHAAAQRTPGAWLVRNSRFATLLTSLQRGSNDNVESSIKKKRPRLTDQEYSERLESMVQECRSVGARPILVVWPLREQMLNNESIVKQEVVRYLGNELDVPVVDLVPEFIANGGTSLFADVVHANQAGHELVADLIEPLLK